MAHRIFIHNLSSALLCILSMGSKKPPLFLDHHPMSNPIVWPGHICQLTHCDGGMVPIHWCDFSQILCGFWAIITWMTWEISWAFLKWMQIFEFCDLCDMEFSGPSDHQTIFRDHSRSLTGREQHKVFPISSCCLENHHFSFHVPGPSMCSFLSVDLAFWCYCHHLPICLFTLGLG